MITIDFTYELYTPESIDAGDMAEGGFITPGYWRYSVEDYDQRTLWQVGNLRQLLRFARELGAVYYNGSWFESVDPDENYATGEHFMYAMHIAGVTPSTEARIIRLLESGNY